MKTQHTRNIRTWHGTYRLSDSGGTFASQAEGPSKPPDDQSLFFLLTSLKHRDPAALHDIINAYAGICGTEPHPLPPVHEIPDRELDLIAQDLLWRVQTRQWCVEKIDPLKNLYVRDVAAPPQEAVAESPEVVEPWVQPAEGKTSASDVQEAPAPVAENQATAEPAVKETDPKEKEVAPAKTPDEMQGETGGGSAKAAQNISRFEVTVVDEINTPLDGINLTFTIEGIQYPAVTDGSGTAIVEKAPGAVASVALVNADQVRKKVKPLWNTIRGGAWVKASAEKHIAVVQVYGDKFDTVQAIAPKTPWTISVQPRVIMVRTMGIWFDTNKCFLLPTAIEFLKQIVHLYDNNKKTKVLIVGHTDTEGQDAFNEDLSLNRAKAMAAFLKDNPDPWLHWYGEGISQSQRWGKPEDDMMIASLAESAGTVPDGDPVAWYQEWHNNKTDEKSLSGSEHLKVDGKLGPETRRQLILDYMGQDNTSLPTDIEPIVHGCGEYFPLDETEQGLDPVPRDETWDLTDRRVELFFFDQELGVQPAPKGEKSKKGSEEYLEWRKRATKASIIYASTNGTREIRVQLMNWDGLPFNSKPYLLHWDTWGETVGKTDDQGIVSVQVTAGEGSGFVRVWPDEADTEEYLEWKIQTGPVPPANDPRGASIRLANLDYYSGPAVDTVTDELRQSIRFFQYDNQFDVLTGDLDDPTVAKINEDHDIWV
jgi:outer membrane protein OmpA-like peptidoglycan-associated protein